MSLPLLVAFVGTAIVILTPLCLPLRRRPRDDGDARPGTRDTLPRS